MAIRTGKVIIAKNIKLDKDYNDVLTYSESEMLNLVTQNKIADATNCSFIEVGKNIIDTPFSYGDSLKSNYIALQNPNYSNKWFFGFVNKVEYINNLTTRIHYTIDEFSTWYDYWTKEDCYIIREHVNNDTIGLHTVPENLEIGEHIEKPLTSSEIIDWEGLTGTCQVVLGLSQPPYGIENIPAVTGGYHMYGGVYSALYYITFPSSNDCTKFINDIQSEITSDIIVTAFMVPQKLLNNVTYITPSGKNFQIGYITSYNGTINLNTLYLSKPTSLDGYVPRNNKLFTSPFCYLMLSNSTGENQIYKYELFKSNNCGFSIDGIISVGCSIKAYPLNYNYSTTPSYSDKHISRSTNMAKLPTCSWKNDAYTNWITANSVDLGLGIGSGIGAMILGGSMIASGVGTVPGAGLMISGFNSIFNSVKADYQASLIPDSVKGGSNQGDIVFATNSTLLPTQFTIKAEYARIVDDYFQKYGYKINRIKSPNLTGRTNYNYVLIGTGENIGYPTGNKYVPAESMEIINNIFRRGVTLWHNHANLGDYSVTNNIVS